MNVGITALATHLPAKRLSNDDLSKIMDTSDEWIYSRTGIKQRFVAAEHEYTSTLAIQTVAKLDPEALKDVDLVIVATATPDAYFPSVAALVQDHFKLKAAAFDLSAACAGWVYALNVGVSQIQSGISRKALVIGAETLSKITNWEDRTTAVLFGDGAGAAILEEVPEPYGFKSFAWGTDGSGGKHLHAGATSRVLPSGDPMQVHIVQNGREVFKFATRVIPEAIQVAVEKAGLRVEDLDRIVPHQANARIIESAADRLGLDINKFVISLHEHANNSSATIPLALEYGVREGLVHKGDTIALAGFGGGLTWASGVLVWGH
ncbi:beta-ketoacyl-ACP synthase III [Deinococcus cellulosilyticus]|uniref:Beta-ketoacyl-[acyl-carrier-protein] synthase III n=1 Tax=Deinococcus cellulosilyticus (strain DSM 18568 / NBRC 106333 / KACC 11606 / 5516J-15) TaxID=1223518 RepID=A0A511N110_DEIC1|nr:beta-ketoacyl-ACP synthase III [Deinococcus cellulosilyticus]GEM46151.1 3-oxoacyl-[acyl-carrier-protein] synthase 3 [Deinococcus cellulosilyticus NBRC 106333 = KACC 11606]